MIRQQGGDGISVDWSKYSTPQQSVARRANPSDNAVLRFIVGDVRKIPMDVKHAPIKQNRAHSLISKLSEDKRRKMRQRDELAKIAKWVIEFR